MGNTRPVGSRKMSWLGWPHAGSTRVRHLPVFANGLLILALALCWVASGCAEASNQDALTTHAVRTAFSRQGFITLPDGGTVLPSGFLQDYGLSTKSPQRLVLAHVDVFVSTERAKIWAKHQLATTYQVENVVLVVQPAIRRGDASRALRAMRQLGSPVRR